ncbi:MAG: glycosyl transferase [Anaerolineae bacterium]|nr:MAG: glycosyl transferase [Anaerolineae bacterium]
MVGMRVVHLSKVTGIAGSENHLLALLPGLRARDVDARLWALTEPGKPIEHLVAQAQTLGIPVTRLTIRHDADITLVWRLARLLRRERPDIVHTHLIHADLYGTVAARLAGLPWVISSRHNDDRFRYRLPVRLLNRLLWHWTDAGIAISDAIRDFSIRIEGAPAGRIHTIHYGLDPATLPALPAARHEVRMRLGLPDDALLIGSACRLIEQKGLSYALSGFASVAQDFPQAHYVIAGDGPLRSDLQRQAEALRIAERVHFLGWQDRVYPVLASLDVFLAPSLWEGFGLVLLEAMAYHLPIISTRVSAIPEIVLDGETGWLVSPRDADALAKALRAALADPLERQRRGELGRQRLEREFTVAAMVERTLALYRHLQGKR